MVSLNLSSPVRGYINLFMTINYVTFSAIVEGGHRAIMFNRIGGISDDIYTEGLHFR